MSCPLHPGGGYGCANCDAIYRREAKKADERDALRARVSELEAALRNLVNVAESADLSVHGGQAEVNEARKVLEVKP